MPGSPKRDNKALLPEEDIPAAVDFLVANSGVGSTKPHRTTSTEGLRTLNSVTHKALTPRDYYK